MDLICDKNPLITFFLLAYNQERFIAEAVQGALSQTYSPLEIILSDDCSSDRTFEIMQEMAAAYHGPNQVIVRQNEKNLGLVGHINRVMELVNGELIIIAAGDDVSMAHRAEVIAREYIKSGKKACSIFSNAVWIDLDGRKMNLLHKKPILPEELELTSYATRSHPGFVNGCTHACKKEVLDFFGPIPLEARAEDIIIPFRSALLGGIAYISEPLVLYRQDDTRMRNRYGLYDFAIFRKRWLKHASSHLAMYKSRLADMEKFKLMKTDPEGYKIIQEYTYNKIIKLEKKLSIFSDVGGENDAKKLLAFIRMKFHEIEIVLTYLKIILYFLFQRIILAYKNLVKMSTVNV